jgi:PII-like signaling protein
VLTVIVDTPANIHRWFAIVDELTEQTGLVTSEIVPAYRARAGDRRHGGLRLAHRWND